MKNRSTLHVDLNILAENFSLLNQLCPNKSVLFMVKANAYGHGILPVVRYCVQELGIKEFGCATLAEAIHLRERLGDLEFEIFVFSDIRMEFYENASLYLDYRIIPVLANFMELSIVLENPEFRFMPLCLKFNTGMNRLGFTLDELPELVKKLKGHNRIHVHHVLTHFANGSLDLSHNKRNKVQLESFQKVKTFLREHQIVIEHSSLANSGVIEQGGGNTEDETHVRPGIIMYGPSSLLPKYSQLGKWQGKLVSKLETYIIHSFEVDKGAPIGYGATPCAHDGVIAILAIGYGDGFFNSYHGAKLNYKGHEGTVVGRVNMDMTYVLFKKEVLKDLVLHDKFYIWDSKDSLERFCGNTKTIAHEVICSLSPRVFRNYLN